jgi:GNAT superfamily N-acetyltransferase
MHTIERLNLPASDADLRDLAELLVHVVNAGAAVSFLPPLSLERAEAWWRETLTSAGPGAVFLVARDAAGIVGSVQLHPAWAPNQPHRADVAKLMVHGRSRRLGIARQLMEALEVAAQRGGFRLLTLDTKRGDGAEQLYRRLGWITAGAIPGYALNPDGTTHDTVIFYKEFR